MLTLTREPTSAQRRHRTVLAVVWQLVEEQSGRPCKVTEIVDRLESIGDSPHYWGGMTSGNQCVRNALQALERDGHVERSPVGVIVCWAPVLGRLSPARRTGRAPET